MDLKEVEHEYVNGIYLSQDRVRWRAVVEHGHDKGASLSITAEIFLISLATATISISTVLCVVTFQEIRYRK
jgi:hypothetical protein